MPKRAIVLVIDRLGAGHLGPYGNTLFPTPGFNRLGSGSWLAERTLADCPDLAHAYRAWLTGRHALCPAAPEGDDLCHRLAALGVGSSLLTDDPTVSELAAAYGFGEMSELPTVPPSEAATEIAATQTADFFAALLKELGELPESHLLWAHARGLGGPWDAPRELRDLLAEEDDPPPYAGLDPPAGQIEETSAAEITAEITPHSHAERWPLVCSHAAQLLVVDACLETLLDALESLPAADTLLLVTSPRGFPLGEHGAVGDSAHSLHAELLHVPLFLRLPAGAGAAARGAVLAQPADIAATLLAFFGGAPFPPGGDARDLLPYVADSGELPPPRERAVTVEAVAIDADPDSTRAVLHTPDWCWHGALSATAEPSPEMTGQLYVKPDDRWEVNEVADRCPDIAEALQAELLQFAELASRTQLDQLPPLAPPLVADLRQTAAE